MFKEMCSVGDGKCHPHNVDCSNDCIPSFILESKSRSQFSSSVIPYKLSYC
jgi:hypothetical protein